MKSSVKNPDSSQLRQKFKRHEQAMIVVLSYMIGFITAMIAFYIGSNHVYDYIDSYSFNLSPVTYSMGDANVLVKEANLFVVRKGQEKVLSVRSPSGTVADGFHYQIVVASMSPKKNFVHYCVQAKAEDTECVNFIYSIKDDAVYKVSNGTDQVLSEIEKTINSEWTKEGFLKLEDYISVDVAKPWIVASEQDSLI